MDIEVVLSMKLQDVNVLLHHEWILDNKCRNKKQVDHATLQVHNTVVRMLVETM